ncbi:MAG: sensor histidine kinase [Terracidiphilus sp.]|jgi:signal transduction histidine kinase
MQQTGQAIGLDGSGIAAASLTTGTSGSERKRVEAVVETLAKLRGDGETLAEVAHDARNMVTALTLYCDLLEEPGVLTPAYLHYGNELRLVATASRRLVEKLLALDLRLGAVSLPGLTASPASIRPGAEVQHSSRQERARRWDLAPAEPIDDLAGELRANRNLLAALAGPAITLTVDAVGGARAVRLSGEDLTRILVNLVKNAAEAMPEGGCIQLGLCERCDPEGAVKALTLTVADDGPGIATKALGKIFDSGYTTHATGVFRHGGWPASHRGLGLSITRSIVEAAGGSIRATNRLPSGACFEIELPVRSR